MTARRQAYNELIEPHSSTDEARAAAKGGASLLVLQSLGRVCGLLFVVIVTRHLPPDEFGRYSTVAAVVLFGNFLGDFGTSAAITRMVSRAPARADRLLSATLLGSLMLGLLAYAGAVAFAAINYQRVTLADMAIGAAAIPAAAMLSSILGALDGNGMIARRAAISALQTFTVAAGAIPVLFGTGVRGALVAMAAAPLICLLLAATVARRAGLWSSPLRLDVRQTLDLLRSAAPYAATGGLAALTMRFDVVLLSLVTTSAETARYDLALRLLEAGTYLSTALTAPLLFLLSRRLGTGDREGASRVFAEAVRLLYLLGLPMSLGLAVLARPVVSIALGPQFADAAVPFAIMAAAQWLTWLVSTQSALVMSGDHMGRAVLVGLAIAGVTVALDVVLVPTLGATGAATAMVVSWVFAAVLLHRFAQRTAGIGTARPSGPVLVSTAVMGVVVVMLRDLPLVLSITASVLVYALTAIATGAFSKRDGLRLLRLLRGRPDVAPGAAGELEWVKHPS
jgi:O-antigen/teichoic acid export membrane protein